MFKSAAVVGLAGILIGSTLTFLAQIVTSSQQLDAKMVDGILRAEPKDDVKPIRAWAVRTINYHAKIRFSTEESEILMGKALPYTPSLDFSDPRNSQYLPLL